jgi:hypothetical protein
MTINFTNYIKEHWALIDGWNDHGAFTALEILDDAQSDYGVRGHVCEIGVHEGQYFFAMALLTNENELYIAIDVFDDQHRNIDHSGKASLQRFKENTLKHVGNHDKTCVNLLVVKTDSLRLTPEMLGLQIMNRGKKYLNGIRLMSVDGGHTRTHVLNDLKLAEKSIVDGGVVILDDFMNPKWPGVTEGAHIYCSDPYSRLIPFAYGNKKLYLSTDVAAPYYLQTFRNIVGRLNDAKEVEIWNRQMLWVDFK